MNDYRFGNYVYEKRRLSGLSQSQVARLLGVSDKAVSKWENGKAKPGTDTLRKLAALFHVPIEELLQMREEKREMSIHKIVITGGPSAGKTTGLSWIQNAFTKLGYTVLFVPETATELISNGVAPWTCESNLAYQKCQMRLQLEKEKVFDQAARSMKADKILIVCDRGAMDNRAYMNELEFSQILSEFQTDEVHLRDGYDAVFHMVTAAKGAENFYTTENNEARKESPAQARELDDKLIAAWTGHPHLRVIDNSTDFEDKLKRLIAEIRSFLGEPEPLETERKFLIAYPDVRWLESLPNCRKVDIIQTYLLAKEGEELRVRQRGENGSYLYTKTFKRRVSDASRIEIEERLSQSEYLDLLMEADPDKHPIRKTRWCLTYDNQYFEIDLYPFWADQAILEIELRDKGEEIRFPKELHFLREVTGDERYSNANLAGLAPSQLSAHEAALPVPFLKVCERRSVYGDDFYNEYQFNPYYPLGNRSSFDEDVLMSMICNSGRKATQIYFDSDDDCGGVCTCLVYHSIDEYLAPESTHPGDDFVAIMDSLSVSFPDVRIRMDLYRPQSFCVFAKEAGFDLNAFLFPDRSDL